MIEAMKQALETFEDFVDDPRAQEQINASITALRQAIAEAEKQEPVAWWNDTGTHIDLNVSGRGKPLYTHPPKREWVGLTDEEIGDALSVWELTEEWPTFAYAARAIEAKLKQKNGYAEEKNT